MSQVVIEGKPATARVNLVRPVSPLKPADKMFDYALIELVQYVGRDRIEYVGIGQAFPERMEEGLDSCLATCGCECAWPVFNGIKGTKDLV